jgi:hypothetical protein
MAFLSANLNLNVPKSRMALFKFVSDFDCLSSDLMCRGYGRCPMTFLSADLNLSVPSREVPSRKIHQVKFRSRSRVSLRMWCFDLVFGA